MRRRPFEDLEETLERMSDRFDKARVEVGGEIGTAAIDVAEWDGEFIVSADLPGYDDEDIDVRVTDHTLHIEAEHKIEEEEEKEDLNYLRKERTRTTVSRSVQLPEEVDEDNASATYENGVLTVTLPKKHASEEAHRIEVR